MRILVIHQYYLGPGEPGGSRFNELSQLWRAAGHSVNVIAGSVNYTTGRRLDGLPGRLVTHRAEEGVEVWRCHVPASYSRGYAGRMWAFFGFLVSATAALFRVPTPDVVIATSPPLIVVMVGWLASRWHRVPWVFEIRDLWPESAVTTGVLRKDSLLTKLLYGIERFGCRTADRINVLTPAFADDLRQRGLAAAERICFIPNGADLDQFHPHVDRDGPRRALGWEGRFVALYAGAHGRANALHQLVDAAERLRARPDILICCVGDGPERENCASSAAARGLSNIAFLGARPKREMPGLIAACDVGLAVLQNNPTFRTVYPNKVFDYMAVGRPSVVAIDGVARRLVCDEANAGLFAEPESGEAMAAALIRLAGDPELCARLGRNGRAWVEANAARSVLASRYLEVLSTITRADRS